MLDPAATLAAPAATDRPHRILVVEDDRHVRTLLADLLDAWGYAVEVAAGGREGLARFAPGAYDLVLTDLAMPDVSGLEVAAGLRDRDSAVPLIVLTGVMRDLELEQHRLGFRLLHKPLSIDGLRRALRDSLGAPPAA